MGGSPGTRSGTGPASIGLSKCLAMTEDGSWSISSAGIIVDANFVLSPTGGGCCARASHAGPAGGEKTLVAEERFAWRALFFPRLAIPPIGHIDCTWSGPQLHRAVSVLLLDGYLFLDVRL